LGACEKHDGRHNTTTIANTINCGRGMALLAANTDKVLGNVFFLFSYEASCAIRDLQGVLPYEKIQANE
jgi:hypothetical protein